MFNYKKIIIIFFEEEMNFVRYKCAIQVKVLSVGSLISFIVYMLLCVRTPPVRLSVCKVAMIYFLIR